VSAVFTPLFKSVLQMETVYLGSILGKDPERTEEYFEQIQKAPALKAFAAFHRASYAYLLLIKRDVQSAERILPELLKKIKNAPYRVETDFEQKQLEHIHSIQ
jgi:hypothetical protein